MRLPRPALLIAVLVAATASAASAQPAEDHGHVTLTLADGAELTLALPRDALEVRTRNATGAACRSCVGRHLVVSLRLDLESSPLARLRLHADVAGRRARFSTGLGPYPARAYVRVEPRERAEDEENLDDEVEVEGRFELVLGRRREGFDTMTFVAAGADSPLQRVVITAPPEPRLDP